jgi:outer membrane protein assembly factor BamB
MAHDHQLFLTSGFCHGGHQSVRSATLLLAGMLLTCLLGATQADAADLDQWGHWRGPLGTGTSPTATPPTEFGPSNNCAWKQPIPGQGSSSPVIWEDSVFVTTAVPVTPGGSELDFRLFCFERATGEKRWDRSAIKAAPHEGTHSTNGYASASPCTDGRHVYAHFGSRGLFCFTMSGDLKWSRDFGDMQTRNEFGEGSSPTLVGDRIVIPWDHEGPSRLICLNALSGETIWDVPRDEPTCWATPLVVTMADGSQQVVMNGQTAARSYDLSTGRELWRCGGQTQRPVASPVAASGLVFIGSGFRGAFLGCFDLTGQGDIEGTSHVHWTVNRDTPDIASPLLHAGRLWYYKEKTGLLTCVDAANGQPHYERQRIPGVSRTYASPVAAGGHIYLTDRSGTITVIKDGPELSVAATNDMGEGVDATPAPVGQQLFIRGERHLFCFGDH